MRTASHVDPDGRDKILAVMYRIADLSIEQESEPLSRLALSAANQGFYDINVQSGAVEVSDEYAQMLGYEPAAFKETAAAWLDGLHPDDRIAVELSYRDCIDSRADTFRVEFRQRACDGGWKWILSIGKIVVFDRDGAPLRMIGTHTDISAIKHAQEELALRQLQLAQVSRSSMVNSLASAVAHELNQPLCAIANYSAAILRALGQAPADLDSVKEDARSANEAAHRAGKIIQRFRGLLSGQEVNAEACRLEDIIGSSLSLIAVPIRDARVHVLTDYAPDLPGVFVDQALFQQVIINLVMNACEAMREVATDRRVLMLRIRENAEQSQIELEVSDTGPGIRSDVVPGLFDACMSTKPMGLGMGLTITKMIVTAHHGSIALKSTVSQGSVFEIHFPIVKSTERGDIL